MKVYDLMSALSKMPAGAEVIFSRLAEKTEIEKYPGEKGLMVLEFTIRDVGLSENKVLLDGWAE